MLTELIAGYTHITGDPVRTPKKRNFIAACYRLHGDDFLPLVQRRFAARGTASNLLGEIRCLAPTPLVNEREPDEPSDQPAVAARAAAEPLPGLTYGERDRPPFDPTSKVRHDRRPSNPDAGLFSDEELGVRGRSITAEALAR